MKRLSLTLMITLVLVLLPFGNSQSQTTQPTERPTLKPFLTLPFLKGTQFRVTEGYVYSAEETAVHGITNHAANDFAALKNGQWAPGTPVVAAHDGWAIAFFHTNPLDRNVKVPDGRTCKVVGMGLGNGVQVWEPNQDVSTGYGHLQAVAAGIPVLDASKRVEHNLTFWDPLPLYVQPSLLLESAPKPVWVKRGQIIGYLGNSGLSCDYDEFPGVKRDEQAQRSWDEPHVHFDVFRRDANGSKGRGIRWDPFDKYAQAPAYADLKQGPRGLWLLNKKGLPAYPGEQQK